MCMLRTIQRKIAVLEKMVDELPAGFSIITEGSPEWQALSTASGSSLQRGWVASADQTNLAPGATRYELPIFPSSDNLQKWWRYL